MANDVNAGDLDVYRGMDDFVGAIGVVFLRGGSRRPCGDAMTLARYGRCVLANISIDRTYAWYWLQSRDFGNEMTHHEKVTTYGVR